MSTKKKHNLVRKCRDSFKGSVTVEASLALFLFLLFFVCMMNFYMILNLEIRMQSALEQTADAQASYAAIKDYHDKDGSFSYIQCCLDYVYAKNSVIRLLGKEYLNSSWVKGGENGLYFAQSDFLKDGSTLNLVVCYQIKVPFFPLSEINMVQKTHRRIWIGDDTSGLKNITLSEEKVYVTPNGTAYHLYADCSYIDVKLQAVSAESLTILRNKDGSIYYACESCHPEKTGIVYVTEYGNRYHSSVTCRAIEKNVIQIGKDEIGNRHLCSKCLKRAGG